MPISSMPSQKPHCPDCATQGDFAGNPCTASPVQLWLVEQVRTCDLTPRRCSCDSSPSLPRLVVFFLCCRTPSHISPPLPTHACHTHTGRIHGHDALEALSDAKLPGTVVYATDLGIAHPILIYSTFIYATPPPLPTHTYPLHFLCCCIAFDYNSQSSCSDVNGKCSQWSLVVQSARGTLHTHTLSTT